MLKNNIEIDVKVKCIEEGITQAQMKDIIEYRTMEYYRRRYVEK